MKITKEWMEKHNPDIADIDKCQFVIDCKKEVFDDMDILIEKIDKRILPLLTSHNVDLNDIQPSYPMLKQKHLNTQDTEQTKEDD